MESNYEKGSKMQTVYFVCLDCAHIQPFPGDQHPDECENCGTDPRYLSKTYDHETACIESDLLLNPEPARTGLNGSHIGNFYAEKIRKQEVPRH